MQKQININMSKLLTFIKNRELEIIIGIGVVAALLSFIFNNEDILITELLFHLLVQFLLG